MTDARDGRAFVKGLFGGALIGAVGGVFFAPEIYAAFKNLRGPLADAAADAGDLAADAYREATTRAAGAVGDLQQKGQAAYGKALSVVTRGADEVKERASEAQAELEQSEAKAGSRRTL